MDNRNGYFAQQGYRPGHVEQVRRENPGPAPMAPNYHHNFPPIQVQAGVDEEIARLLDEWVDRREPQAQHQPSRGGLNPGQPTFTNQLGYQQQQHRMAWNNRGIQAGQHHHQNGGNLGVGNQVFAIQPNSLGLIAPEFENEEEVHFDNQVFPNAQQQPSTSDGPRAGAKPVADISAHDPENQEVLRMAYGDRLNFSTGGPSAAPRDVSPVAVAIPPQPVTPGQRQGPLSGSVGSVVSLTEGSPNEVAPRPRRMAQGPQGDNLFVQGPLAAPSAQRAIPPPGFYPPAPNFMPPPPPQFNIGAGGNLWNLWMLPHGQLVQMLQFYIAQNKKLEAENRDLKRQLRASKGDGSAKKRRHQEDQPSTSTASMAKIKEESADDEDVDDFEQNHGSTAPRTIKREVLDPRDVQPIPNAANDADLAVVAELRPEIRRFSSVAEAIKAAEDEFPEEYFLEKFARFQLPIQTSFSNFFREFVFNAHSLTSVYQLPQGVTRRSKYPKTMFKALLRINTYSGDWKQEEDKWKIVFKVLDNIQFDQKRAGLITWKLPRSAGKKQKE